MQFQNPNFLWALGLLSIPIIIHLFNLRRYKTVYFSDIRFLKNVEKSTKKQKRLKELLVLISRLIALTALIMAFAKPFIPSPEAKTIQDKAIIVVDNSASMQVNENDEIPLERAKQSALKLIEELPNTIELALISAGQEHQTPRFSAINNIKDQISNLQIVDRPLNLALLKEFNDESIYIFSDFQKSTTDLLGFISPMASYTLIPSSAVNNILENICIDSVWTDSPFLIAGQSIDLFIRLKNYSTNEVEVKLDISTNGLPEISLAQVIKPDNDTIVKTSLTQLEKGFNSALVSISNDAIEFDNRYELSFYMPVSNQIVEVFEGRPSKIIEDVFKGEEFQFNSFSSSTVNNEILTNADLIILNGLSSISSGLGSLLASAANSSNLFIIPNAQNASGINPFLNTIGLAQYSSLDTSTNRTRVINTDDPFFKEVFAGSLSNAYWPTVKKSYRFKGKSTKPSFNLMTLANGMPLFVRTANQTTNLFQLAIPLDPEFSDLSTHPVIVPLLIKALMKKDNISHLTGIVGVNSKLNIPNQQQASESPINLAIGKTSYIPRQQSSNGSKALIVGEDLDRAGTYMLIKNDIKIGNISFNISPLESDLKRFTPNELNELITYNNLVNVSVFNAELSNFTSELRQWQLGKQLWKHFLTLALIFVFVEVILLRLLK